MELNSYVQRKNSECQVHPIFIDISKVRIQTPEHRRYTILLSLSQSTETGLCFLVLPPSASPKISSCFQLTSSKTQLEHTIHANYWCKAFKTYRTTLLKASSVTTDNHNILRSMSPPNLPQLARAVTHCLGQLVIHVSSVLMIETDLRSSSEQTL